MNLPFLAGTKKRPVKKGPYKLISPSKYKHSWARSTHEHGTRNPTGKFEAMNKSELIVVMVFNAAFSQSVIVSAVPSICLIA